MTPVASAEVYLLSTLVGLELTPLPQRQGPNRCLSPLLRTASKAVSAGGRLLGRTPTRWRIQMANQVTSVDAKPQQGTHQQINTDRGVSGFHLCHAGLAGP